MPYSSGKVMSSVKVYALTICKFDEQIGLPVLQATAHRVFLHKPYGAIEGYLSTWLLVHQNEVYVLERLLNFTVHRR